MLMDFLPYSELRLRPQLGLFFSGGLGSSPQSRPPQAKNVFGNIGKNTESNGPPVKICPPNVLAPPPPRKKKALATAAAAAAVRGETAGILENPTK